MIVQVQPGKSILERPLVQQSAASVVVYTDDGLPVAVCSDFQGRVIVSTAADPDFGKDLIRLGFSPNRVPEVVKQKVVHRGGRNG